jgi:hypothetical protein
MNLTKALIVLTILGMLSTFSNTFAKPSPKYCKVIAYVISSNDKKFYPGQKICAGQVVRSLSEVTIACINRNNEFIIKSDQELKKCGIDSVFPTKSFEKNRERGDTYSNTIQLLSPSSKFIIVQKHFQLIWLPVKEVKKYTVQVIGLNDSSPEYVTDTNRLSIPLPNNTGVYSIIIKAYSEIREVSSNIFTFTILPERTNQVVNKYLSDIDKLSIQERVKTSLKLSVLGEYNLTKESLSLLTAQVLKDSQDIESCLSLGDIQLVSGLFEEAKMSYQRCKILAASKKDRAAELMVESRIGLFRDFNLLEFSKDKKDSSKFDYH